MNTHKDAISHCLYDFYDEIYAKGFQTIQEVLAERAANSEQITKSVESKPVQSETVSINATAKSVNRNSESVKLW
nr:MAG TPA: hypothetical protein [Caudoviricetes sp.]